MFLKSNVISISSNVKSLKIIIEANKITFNSKANIKVDKQISFHLVPFKDTKPLCKNNGKLSFYNVWLETIQKNNKNPSFINLNAMSVTNAFLLHSTEFQNKGNILIRSFHISTFSCFTSVRNSSLKLGDLLVIDDSGKFTCNGKIIQYAYLLPIVLNSGIITINNYNDVFYCQKIVSNNKFNGTFKIKSNDLISFTGCNNWENANLESPKIFISKKCEIYGNKIEINCDDFEIVSSSINSNQNENSSLVLKIKNNSKNHNSEFKCWEKVIIETNSN